MVANLVDPSWSTQDRNATVREQNRRRHLYLKREDLLLLLVPSHRFGVKDTAFQLVSAVPDTVLEALDNVGILGSIVLLVARINGDFAILVKMNLRSLSIILPLARKLHVLKPRKNLLNALRGMR